MFDFLKKIFSREGQATPKAPPRPAPAPSVPFDDEEDGASPLDPRAGLGPLPAAIRAEGPLSASERDETLETLRHLVWAGFDSRETILEATLESRDDWPETPAEIGRWIEAQLDAMVAAKLAEEAQWPPVVEWDRLEAVFDGLSDQGVVTLHAAGYTRPQGFVEAWAERESRGATGAQGVCFYTLQDVEHALDRGELRIACAAAPEPDAAADAALATRVATALAAAGFDIAAPDAPRETRIAPIEWRKRSPF